jgi:hypothetical protein
VFNNRGGEDVVLNFENGDDVFDLRAVSGVNFFRDLDLVDLGDDVLVDYGRGSFIIEDESFSSIGASDFLL